VTFLDEASQQSLRRHLDAWPEEFSSGCLDWAAQRRGIRTERIQLSRPAGTAPKEWLQLTIGSRRFLYRTGRLLCQNKDAWRNINRRLPRQTVDKHWTKAQLSDLGYSVPEGALFESGKIDAAASYFLKLGRSVCIEPNRGARGDLVLPQIKTLPAFEEAFRRVAERYDSIIVEEDVSGDVVRFLYVEPRVTAFRVEVPANVTGDGRSSVAELISAKNGERARRDLPSHPPMQVDAEAIRYLETQNLNLASVPPAGCRVFVRGTSNAPSGGEITCWPDSVHPSYARLVEEMGSGFKDLNVAGFDLVIHTPLEPAEPRNYKVLEINSSPGLVVFYFPWAGVGQDAAAAILDKLVSGEW
jgi:D-alanine-D-alanine ligase-like ATP-grasp enzyme